MGSDAEVSAWGGGPLCWELRTVVIVCLDGPRLRILGAERIRALFLFEIS